MIPDWRRRLTEIVQEVGEDAVLEALNAPTSEEMATLREELAELAAAGRRIDEQLADLRRAPEASPEDVRVVDAMIARNKTFWGNVYAMQNARKQERKQAAGARRTAILALANEANAAHVGRGLTRHVQERMARLGYECSARTIRRYLREIRA